MNAGFARDFGFGTPSDFTESPARRPPQRPLRGRAPAAHRNPGLVPGPDVRVPAARRRCRPYYGDAVTLDTTSADPRVWMAILPTQYRWLQQWAAGDFEADGVPVRRDWDALTPAEQVRLIDRGVLDETLGGPFHPGAEFTWPMRNRLLYDAPFRIKRRAVAAEPELRDAACLVGRARRGRTPRRRDGRATSPAGWRCPGRPTPRRVSPGYVPYVDDYLPTFWPARVPNDVARPGAVRGPHGPGDAPSPRRRRACVRPAREVARGIATRAARRVPAEGLLPGPGINKFLHELVEGRHHRRAGGPVAGPALPALDLGRDGAHNRRTEGARALDAAAEPRHPTVPIWEHPRFRRR